VGAFVVEAFQEPAAHDVAAVDVVSRTLIRVTCFRPVPGGHQ